MVLKALQLLISMPKLRKLALCEYQTQQRIREIQSGKAKSECFTEEINQKESGNQFKCRSLENLFVDCGLHFTDHWFIGLIQCSAWTLRTLKLCNCPNISCEALLEIRRCRNLEKLEFTRINLESIILHKILEAIGNNLRVLIIRQCSKINRDMVTYAKELECPRLAKFLFNDGHQSAFDEHMWSYENHFILLAGANSAQNLQPVSRIADLNLTNCLS